MFIGHDVYTVQKQIKQIQQGGSEDMINNTPVSQIHIIQQHQAKHKRRLQKILQSRPSRNQYNLSKNFMHMIETKRINHEKWKQYVRNREKDELTSKNEKMFNKLMDITVGEGPYRQAKTQVARKLESSVERSFNSMDENSKLRQSQASANSKRLRSNSLHHNYQLLNIRRSRMIDQENPKLAQRIMEKTGDLNYHRDLEEYRKTREIMCRMQKFHQIKRVIRSSRSKQFQFSEGKIRSKTLPASHQIKFNNLGVVAGRLEQLASEKERGQGTQKKNKIVEDRRYKTIESIRQQTENNVSEFSSKETKALQRQQYQIRDQDQINEYLNAERKITR